MQKRLPRNIKQAGGDREEGWWLCATLGSCFRYGSSQGYMQSCRLPGQEDQPSVWASCISPAGQLLIRKKEKSQWRSKFPQRRGILGTSKT